ncbi:MAG: hypothetical protein WKG01_12350 [Kofleriaceae bacterium]
MTVAACGGTQRLSAPPTGGGFASPPPGMPPSDLDAWRAALGAARERAIGRLRVYREAGKFPRNHRVLGTTPTFVDEHGTPCAVGYLMVRSGHQALVASIARADNNVYVERIVEGPALAWILRSGLTQDECALIQPSYDWERPPRPIEPFVPDDPAPAHDRLVAHFTALDHQLVDATEVSLDAALARLEPEIARGASIVQVVQ